MYIKTNLSAIRMKPTLLVVLLMFLITTFSPIVSIGQDNEDVDPALIGGNHNKAPVRVDGKVLFNVHGIMDIPAEQRAATISKRIQKVAQNHSISPDSVKIVTESEHLKIFAGEEFIMNIYDADAKAEKANRLILAELVCHKTKTAIESYRYDRSRPALIKKSLHAVGSILFFTLVLFVFLWLVRRINIRLQNRIRERIDTVQNKSFNLIRANQLWSAFHIIFKTIKIIAIVLVAGIFLQYFLGLFPWTSSIAAYTFELFLNPIKTIINGFVSFLPSLAFLIIIFLVTRYFLKLIKLLFTGVDQGGIVIKDFDAEWAMPTFRILKIIIIAFAVIIAYPYIPGSESLAFKGVSVFIGVLFSLGSSSFIGNIIAGYSMTYRRAFKKGDRILVDNQVGIVEDQSLMVTRLRSLKNEEIVIPNSILLGSQITNYSSRAKELGLILHTTVGIGYETPWRQVDAMLKLAADRTEGLLKEPPPFVLKQALGDFAVTYEINAYCRDVSGMPKYYTILHQNILDIFNENNVQIMTPAYEGDPEIPKVVPKEQWNTPLASEK